MANQPTKYKKFLAGAASATLVATAIVPTALAAETAATDFSDVAANHTHYAAIMQAVERGLFDGYTDGTFKPENTIDRKGVAKSLAKYVISQSEYKTFEEYITANKLVEKVTPFNDVPATHGDAELFNASLIVKDAGIFTGSNNNLMPGNVITRQQMAKVLVNGFGLKDLAGVESKVTDNDKAQAEFVDFINILSENGVTEVTAFNPTSPVKRGQMASFLNRAYDSAHKVVAPETATKVVSVSATNLKEVVVTFDGTVEKATAADVNNYSIDGKVLSTATLSDDKKSVTLTLDTTSPNTAFTNQAEYKLSFNNVKAGSTVLSAKEHKFTPVDSTLPTVTDVTSLGNKTLRVTFSEPVKAANASNFQVDGKTVIGFTEVTGNSVIVKLYSALDNGEHTVNVKNVTDFNEFKSLSQDVKFNVVEDVTAPTISSVEEASFEEVVIKFSEPVDPATVLAANVHWLQGNTKMTAGSVTRLADDTYAFDFTNNKIQYTTDLYVSGVKDYSGNSLASGAKIQVTPVVDQTRPEVVNVDMTSRSELTVKFSKVLNEASAETAANYVIKDADGKEVSKLKTVVQQADTKVVKVFLTTPLAEGKKYTLSISGVSDNTTLKNVILPYTKELTTTDTTNAVVAADAVVRNSTTNSLVVTFPEVMAVSGDGSIVDSSKYLYDVDGTWKALPSGVNFNVTPDGKSVIISFPTDVDVDNVDNLRIQLVKDTAGNYIKDLSVDRAVQAPGTVSIVGVTATANNEIEVDFNANLLSNTINAADFAVKTDEVSPSTLSVVKAELSSSDASVVVLTLADSTKLAENATYNVKDVEVQVRANARTATPSGIAIDANVAGVRVDDAINATIKEVVGAADGSQFKVVFNEELDAVATTGTSEATDLVIKSGSTTLIPGVDYEVTAAANSTDLVVTFTGTTTNRTGVMTVALPAPRFLEDEAGNVVSTTSEAIQFEVDNAAPTVAAGVAAPATNSVTTLVLTASEALHDATTGTAIADAADVKAYLDGATAAKINTAVYDATNKTITIAFKTAADAPVTADVISTKNLADKAKKSLLNQKFTFDGAKWVQANK
ncbi:S-layer homology domain-containing protein [Psychrobacillus sp. INOP01]|uniref:Ig-like domain-containing protein n=1 Tax=Psychrobacillus sp. INOP01 TaxID=2829187 RepID=UPI001BA6AB28|nr:Ig-like domain-containing protein [Psychrobacillus sp. INOP01]QUG40556.1 S-layer homology domain-containing protein [Psychrobacillus sp. INOP01]